MISLSASNESLKPPAKHHNVGFQATSQLLAKLHSLGLIASRRGLELADGVSASSFCRRRLPVVMLNSGMAQSVRVEQRMRRMNLLIETNNRLIDGDRLANRSIRIVFDDPRARRCHSQTRLIMWSLAKI